MSERKPARERVGRALLRRPFRNDLLYRGWLTWIFRARQHIVCRLNIEIEGWPRFKRPLRIAFLSDFHVGSHADDIARLTHILAETANFEPDLVLFGGDFLNMSLLFGDRIMPPVIAALLARLDGPLGRFAVLGNHDYIYDEHAVAAALRAHGITVLNYERRPVTFANHVLDILGLPDAHVVREPARALLATLRPDRPAIVLAHDPAWFASVPEGPFLTLAGHTHGGQIRLPGLGVLTNFSKAPRRWSHGMIIEEGRHLYVTAGLGTSGMPIRMGVPPEFAILDVNGAQSEPNTFGNWRSSGGPRGNAGVASLQ